MVDELDSGQYLAGIIGSEVLVATANDPSAYHLLPSGSAVQPPAGIDVVYAESVIRVGLVFEDRSGSWYDSDGNLLWHRTGGEPADSRIVGIRSSGQVVAMEYGPSRIVLVENGEVVVVRIPEGQPTTGAGFGLTFQMTDNLFLGYVDMDDATRVAVAVYDLNYDEVRPLDRLPADFGAAQFPIGFSRGTYYVVATGDEECLNVRSQPDTNSEILGCYEDGVLLLYRSDEPRIEGVLWEPVATPDGRPGWAISQYLTSP